MTKHPGNPWWSQANDVPIVPSDLEAWNEARAAGHITVEHVLLRLEAIVRVALDQPVDGGAAYDEDGFVRALVAAGWSGEGGWRVQLHPNDHDPPHVHFRDKGDPKKEIRLSLATGEPLAGEAIPVGVKKKLARAGDFILENQDLLMSRWREYHG